ncbi:centrosomal protein POC5 isoform X2 [Alosa pseudoharengus]
MSSDEGEPSSPALPKDSDQGSSVSSELQDEYEELLRHAVVTPKFEPSTPSQLLQMSQLSASGPISHLLEGRRSQPTEEDSGRHSGRGVTSTRATPLDRDSSHVQASEDMEMLGRSPRNESVPERQQTASETSRQSSPDAVITVETEVSVSEENMTRMENLLDMWSDNLKTNVLMELRKWKLAFAEQHKLALRKEREKHAADMVAVNAEMDGLKDLLHTYELSSQRKDEVIKNLSYALDRQRERLEMMRSFTQWRLRHGALREEAQGGRMAEQHYQQQLKKKVWAAWHSLISSRWKERVERACRARAEEVCVQLSNDYEAKMAENVEALQKAQAEIQKLHLERDRYEDSMKKAFMRGVCALNMEALSMFHGGEGRPQEHDAPPPRDDPSFGSLAGLQPRPTSSFSDVAFTMETQAAALAPSRSDADRMSPGPGPSLFLSHMGPDSSMGLPRAEALPPSSTTSTTGSSAVPLGGTVMGTVTSHRQVSGRATSGGPQRPSRTVTARVTGHTDMTRTHMPSSLRVTRTGQSRSSVVVERHHPVTQFTVEQTAAARYPRSIHQAQALPGSRSSRDPRAHSSAHIHTVKVVE